MTSSRFILIFLGFIFVIIVLLTSSRIAGALRSRFGKLIPSIFPITASSSPTPKISQITPNVLPSPTSYASRFPTGTPKGGSNAPTAQRDAPDGASQSSQTGETPATGPETLLYALLGGSFLTGSLLKRYSKR